MPIFDTHIVVDWSARSKPSPVRPSRDSIWWAAVRAGHALKPRYLRTRHDAVESLAAFVAGELDAGRRVLAGFDFPFGYPAGVAERLTGEASALAVWDWLAERIEDEPDNGNNRFAVAEEMNRCWPGVGPFWGRPQAWRYPQIPVRARDRTCRDGHPPERRIADLRARGAKTVWQLAYSGSVGSQVLVGLPALKRLLADPRIGGRGRVWPFDTGLASSRTPARRRSSSRNSTRRFSGKRLPGAGATAKSSTAPRCASMQRHLRGWTDGAALPHCSQERVTCRKTNAA